MRLSTLFLCLIGLSFAYASPNELASCSAGTGTASACHSGVIVLFDATNDVTGGSRKLENSWNFVTKQLMPAMNSKATWVFSVYGDQGLLNNDCPIFLTSPSTNSSAICNSLDGVYNELLSKDIFATMNLTTVANKLEQCIGTNQVYNLLLLVTENKDQSDIQSALSIFKSMSIDVVVINLGSGDFSPVPSLCPKQPLGEQNQKELVDGLRNAFCGKPIGPLDCHYEPVSNNQSYCPCKYEDAWLDIFVLVDGSTNIGLSSFNEAKDFMASILSTISIGQGEKQTRVGSIVYADNAQLASKLSTFKSTRDMETAFFGLKFLSQPNTNIDSAVNIARDMFEDPNEHRPNTRKVIIIHASTFRANSNYTETVTFAETFKDNNGIVIVVLHGDDHGHAASILKKIASDDYFFDLHDNPDPNVLTQFFKKSLCNANCFCKGKYRNVDNDQGNQLTPSDGCFWSSTEPVTGALLGMACDQQFGKPAIAKVADERIQIARNSPASPFLVGLTYDGASRQWIWQDNTPYTPGQNDQNNPELDHAKGNCAVIQRSSGFNFPLKATNCDDLVYYACQTSPCSTANFCPDE